MKNTILACAALTATVLASIPAHAVENDSRWYLSAMIGGIDTAKERGADDDFAAYQLGVGKRLGNGWASVEGTAYYGNYDRREIGSKTVQIQWGGGVDFIAEWRRSDSFQPYGLVGAGYLVTDKKLGLEDEDGPMFQVGVGVKTRIKWGLEFRTDVRARRDYGGSDVLTDYIWNIGFNFPLSGRRVDTRTLPGSSASGSAAPVYSFVPDTDNDGYLDPEDRCPNTAGGEKVNQYGCAPSDDADGDNVPNDADMCGDTPAGEPVDKYGCRVTPPDQLSAPTDSN